MSTDLIAAAWQAARAQFEPKVRRWASPLDMACDLDPKMVRTPALNVINDALVRLADRPGQGKLAVFMSPQEGKSSLCTYWNPLWLLVDNPDLRIMAVSYNAEKAREWGSQVKTTIENFSGHDGMVDLGLRLRTDTRAAGRWKVEGAEGGLYCAGIESGISGRPGDYICVDDPCKGLQDARSSAMRESVTQTYQGAIVPRLGPNSKIVWIQTLWHESETIQQILATEGDDWEVIRIPAIADSPDDPLGRKIGEPMQSARGHRDWAKIRRAVGEYVFSAVYQQRPAPAEGGMFKRLWWRYWRPAPQIGTGERIDVAGRIWPLSECWRFATADLAASTRTSADWTVVSAWAITLDGDLVLLDSVRARVGEDGHAALARPLVERWHLDTVYIEATQHSSTLVRDLTREGIPTAPLKAESDKFTRALPYSARASSGRVWLPAGAPWVGDWVSEHASFPNGTNDDRVDTGSYAVGLAVRRWTPIVPSPAPVAPPRELDLMTVPL